MIVAAEFPPLKTIGRIRTVKFLEHLRRHGWRSIVVTLEPGGHEVHFDPSLIAEIPGDTEVFRVPLVTFDERITRFAKRLLGRSTALSDTHAYALPPTGDARPPRGAAAHAIPEATVLQRLQLMIKQWIRVGLDVPDNYLPWALASITGVRELCRRHKVDVIFTTLPPFSAAFVGYKLTKETGIPWIADYRDLWYGDVLREWLPRWRQRFELVLEKRILKRAAAVVTVSEQKTDYMRRMHPRIPARWETLTNGYDTEIYAVRARTRGFNDGRIEFLYTGRLFKNRRGYAFAEALGRLKRDRPDLVRPVRVRMLGGVSPEIAGRYGEIITEYSLQEHFSFAGDVGYAEAMDAQVNCDYLLLIVDTGETSDGVIPGKLFEYVAARRPIFALCDPGATQQIIERGSLGTVVNAEDVDACERQLRDVLSRPVPSSLSADDAYLAQFDRKNITARLARLLDEVSSATGS